METKSPFTTSRLPSSPSPDSRPFSRPMGDFIHRVRQDRLGPFLRTQRCLSRDGLSLNVGLLLPVNQDV